MTAARAGAIPPNSSPGKPLNIEGALARLPLFRGLNRHDIARIAAAVNVVAMPRATVIYRQGAPCDGFHIVFSGQVKLALQTGHSHEKVIELVGPGQSFGEAAMFLNQPHVVTAAALADSRLLHIPRSVVMDELARDPRFAQRIIAGLSRRLHQFIAELEALSLRSGTERVIGYLAKQRPKQRGVNEWIATLPASKGIIASQLNLTQEHFSRILHDLSAAGLIDVSGRKIRILDTGRLLAYTS